jgi:citrate lyase beta subunit
MVRSANSRVNKEKEAEIHDVIADLEEGVEETMHESARLVPNSEEGHARASKVSAQARRHRRAAEKLREENEPSNR